MKRLFASIALLLALFGTAGAQEQYPEGLAVYSLPSTVIGLDVTAVRETFTAGPYAKYAEKYLGFKAETANSVKFHLKSVTVNNLVEADPKEIHAIKLSASDASSSAFIKFTSQGLILFADGAAGGRSVWRFPSAEGNADFNSKDLGENLTSVSTTLYKSVKTEEGFNKVAVQQSEVVEKSIEKKAAEAAQRIFDLRKSRIQISTGDTDASFSGEALGAAIAEINRLEKDYLSLFAGITEISEQQMHYEVIPTVSNAKQMYVAFRISDEEGLVPAGSTAGRPVVLSLTGETQPSVASTTSDRKKIVTQAIYYRIPSYVTAKLMDGQKTLLSTRMPVYQLGHKVCIPL